ncbi:MAG: Gfo/Idh/MocA family oxidoreductase [Planctomycetales bacterium]|nr:Gfo/Idh/MocA family oxidoreductase [Planctomycetales bacterium]
MQKVNPHRSRTDESTRGMSSRRTFLRHTAAGAALVAVPTFVPARILGREAGAAPASETILVGVIGTGGRARQLMDQLPETARIVAIADCYEKRMAETLAEKGTDWRTYRDYRRMFDAEQLDAVVIATPDHGRSLPCIRACQAGLDVYAEKPLTAYIREGRAVVDAARRHGTVFQVGTQQRTMEINDYCCHLVRSGGIGELKVVQAVNYTGPTRYEGLPEQPVPEGDDWDMWCGPTELRPFHPDLQFGWMRWRAYSGGEMTNWGAHGVDQIQWALGKSDTGPRELWPVTPGPNGKVSMRYDDGTLVRFELEGGPMGGAIFTGSDAKIEINRNKFTTNPPDFAADAPDPAVREKWEGPGWTARPHLANWLQCIKTRERPNADVEIGHRSISVCHLVNITRELGRKLTWNPETEQFEGDDEANRLVDRPRRAGYELPTV